MHRGWSSCLTRRLIASILRWYVVPVLSNFVLAVIEHWLFFFFLVELV